MFGMFWLLVSKHGSERLLLEFKGKLDPMLHVLCVGLHSLGFVVTPSDGSRMVLIKKYISFFLQ